MDTKICLNMLVSERDVSVFQALQSIKPYIDYWVIADMGCDARTIERIQLILSGIEGEFVDIEVDNIANSKNSLIEYSKQFGDYLLLADADNVFKPDTSFKQTALSADGYFIKASMPVCYSEIRLIKSDRIWAYQGAACEVLLAKDDYQLDTLPELSFVSIKSSKQIEEENQIQVQILSESLKQCANDAHAQFYMARLKMQQSEWQQSLEHFENYLQCEQKWDAQWHWYTLYHRAKLMEMLEADAATVIAQYLRAFDFRPTRAEPLYELARLHRLKQDFTMANLYSTMAFSTPLPERETFDLETAVYHWHIPCEHALSSQKLHKQAEAIRAANFALRYGQEHVSKNMRDALVFNRQLDVEALQKQKLANTEGRDELVGSKGKNRIRLVIPFRNAKSFLEKSIRSIKAQNYDNFTATFIDDFSQDGSANLVPVDDDRFELITNKERVGPLLNRLNVILSCDPHEIIFYLDGDDQLACNDALGFVNDMYNQHDCWLSYGQYISQNDTFGYAQPYANQQQLINELESGEMRFPIHPITHRAGLLQSLRNFDPELNCYKDHNGNWLFYASDAVLARPLFYLAGFEHIHYCNRVLYLYTEGHEISESIDNKEDQMAACRIISSRLRPPKIASYITV